MKHAISSCLLGLGLTVATGVHADTTLRLGHLWPAQSAVNQDLIEAWAEQVEKDASGELEVEIYPSQTLSKASSAYEGVVNGVADITVTLQGYTAGRFPLTEIVQLPGVSASAPQGACILQSLYDEGALGDEYADSHLLFLFTTGPAPLHTRDTEVQTPADLEGLRMRTPSEVSSDMLESMGADPVGMPAPDIYTALQRGVIDGLSLPWEAMKVFQVNELASYHLDIPYYTGALMATMNRDTYEALPPRARQAIDANSGMRWAKTAGEVFYRLDAEGKQQAREQGDTIHSVEDPLNDPQWSGPLKRGTERYLERLEERGLADAEKVYQAALELRNTTCQR
ncbi:TRAP transporter substrate-binding protein [Modicisalibacter radicis]|uniref:TRAP transporter substrate-binding protein n=1 Tax=Halomonas sp. EAR18 TaxID=2518972 RepID=UPI00109C19FC|nr:TRAP transporter substrate-binding protein [Halomonas sp. EAR18]